ncbi:hypothetical protein D4765_07415 [Subtercola vilae]|uniref:Uncharacterized protein n=1 Tax=Subtercola vilae TaxID=2056433 RepID=A0A4T2C6K1_9MICO|nr:hypothetical protein D4765_07415 [Subtercola vilae]
MRRCHRPSARSPRRRRPRCRRPTLCAAGRADRRDGRGFRCEARRARGCGHPTVHRGARGRRPSRFPARSRAGSRRRPARAAAHATRRPPRTRL